MSATRGLTLADDPYPKVSTMEWKITEAKKELHFLKQTQERQGMERINLIRRSETTENNEELDKLEAEIISTQSIKIRVQDRITDLEERLPIALAQAKQTEADLITAKEKVAKSKIELAKIDEKITASLKEPMKLIRSRTETALNLEKQVSQVSSLTTELHWNYKDEPLPLEPAIFDELQKLLPKPLVVKWRGR